jgi:hypothetical protein
MPARIAALALAGLALAGAGCPGGNEVRPRPPRSTELPLPRDGDVAVREELDAARRAGTLAAYDLFLGRHPRHRLAATARRERARIAARAGK